ncbi:putative mitotic spindle checkpoint protein [Jimgerdemannia flammicorona]|uniref:Putative mitotic spindle checkpoint protein n=1 Tax=Jimgerdemannia flammicorona TaxID=994334 RepID=A0A433QHK6_9FUNG|nr:putative mitotic spindle checkpoint protein [Jimgerdemannia flammicorona]
MVKKYGLNMLVTTDDALESYLKQICEQLDVWLANGKISKLVLAIKSKETTEVLERWQFDIQVIDGAGNKEKADRSDRAEDGEGDQRRDPGHHPPDHRQRYLPAYARREIPPRATTMILIIPLNLGTFNILVYADKDAEVPTTWCDSDPHLLKGGSEHVKLRSFSTNFHKVDALVAYRRNDDV